LSLVATTKKKKTIFQFNEIAHSSGCNNENALSYRAQTDVLNASCIVMLRESLQQKCCADIEKKSLIRLLNFFSAQTFFRIG